MNRLTFKNRLPLKRDTRAEVLKVTALIYLDDALRKEEYEKCAGLLRQARGFGATEAEVKGVLKPFITRVKRAGR
ncbi:MAG: hypothetical protein Q8Q08_08835 [Candidatus Omnitrophota bacterium]|nr:hypothetical protein [Candidatus Omnitrophota bacterium]MDZ4243360.1 hypothetical protein [Candidatus Omnitrophota bacterium]